jgi:hypothetical protein
VETIVNLICDGRLADFTLGSLYFQNPNLVAARARRGEAPLSLVAFGGAPPTAVIGRQTFYRTVPLRPRTVRRRARIPGKATPTARPDGDIFYAAAELGPWRTAIDASAGRSEGPDRLQYGPSTDDEDQ